MKNSRKEKRPLKHYDHLDDAFSNASSQTECTGLISHAPLTDEELESFRDIYDYAPPDLSHKIDEEGDGPALGSDITSDNIR